MSMHIPPNTPAFRIADMDVQGWEPSMNSAVFQQVPSTVELATTQQPLQTQRPLSTNSLVQATSSVSFSSFIQPQKSTSLATPSSSRSAAAAGRTSQRARTSTERKIARKLAENAAYVPRPRNSFIIFRTDFVAYRMSVESGRVSTIAADVWEALSTLTMKDSKGRVKEQEGSLSKQASAVWNRMSEGERKPWAERAEKEKALHAEKHPDYRYKPARHGPIASSSRRSNESCSRSGSQTPHSSGTLPHPALFPSHTALVLPSVPPVPSFAPTANHVEPATHPAVRSDPGSFSAPNSTLNRMTASASDDAGTDFMFWQSREEDSSSRSTEYATSDGNDNDTIDVDIDMYSLFATAHPSPPTNSSVSPSLTQARNTSPLEAIASLWVHDRERMVKSGISLPTTEPHIVSPADAILSGSENAIGSGSFDDSFLSFLPDALPTGSFSDSNELNQDFRFYDDFSFDLDAELARVGYDENGRLTTASTYGYPEMAGCSPTQATFAMDYSHRPYDISLGGQPHRYA